MLSTSQKSDIINVLTPVETALGTSPLPDNFDNLVSNAQATLLNIINEYFKPILEVVPGIKNYINRLTGTKITAEEVIRRFPRIYEGDEDWD